MTDSGPVAGDTLVASRRRPKRRDSRETIRQILDTAARLLENVGFEDLSTNMICREAGLTPPALYHYYPNKYAILFDLAHGLLSQQHSVMTGWIDEGGLGWRTVDQGVQSFETLQQQLRAVADAQPGALWIMRGMRAIPRLRDVRIAAHAVMVEQLLSALCARYPGVVKERLAVPSFLLGEVIHMGAELELDYPALDAGQLRSHLASNLAAFIRTLE